MSAHKKMFFQYDWRRAPSAAVSVRMTKENHSNNLRGQVYDSHEKEMQHFQTWSEGDRYMLIGLSLSEGARTQTC